MGAALLLLLPLSSPLPYLLISSPSSTLFAMSLQVHKFQVQTVGCYHHSSLCTAFHFSQYSLAPQFGFLYILFIP